VSACLSVHDHNLRNYTSDLHEIFVHVMMLRNTDGRGSILLWQSGGVAIRYAFPVYG